MITGEIKNKLDRLWDAMWSNQMTNPWIDIQQVILNIPKYSTEIPRRFIRLSKCCTRL